MARIARVVIPGIPHMITQRGNRSQPVFFSEADYRAYIDMLGDGCRKVGVSVWAWCLLPSKIHLIAVPPEKDSLRAAIADVNRRYARIINGRESLTGHLWQDRFSSFPMDHKFTMAAARLIENMPVAAGLVKSPGDYAWSSAKSHVNGQGDILIGTSAIIPDMAGGVDAWRMFLNTPIDAGVLKVLDLHETTGRPLGDKNFQAEMERRTGRSLIPGKRGPKPKGQ